MNKKIILITNYNNEIPQILHETVSLDVRSLKDILGTEFECESYTLDEFSNLLLEGIQIESTFFYIASSQIESYKMAIVDVAFEIKSRGGVLIPGFEFYLSHENKYYQELYKSRVGVETPKSKLFTHAKKSDVKALPYSKTVIKSYNGFGSVGVKLVNTELNFNNALLSSMTHYVFSGLGGIARNATKFFYKYRNKYPSSFGRVVAQEFIPSLQFDWKVLVFSENVFSLKRYVRPNDFRASGSGKFDYRAEIPDTLVKFASYIRKKLNVPFVSLDIAETENGEFFVIEYQAVHFGMATVVNAKRYHTILNNEVVQVDVEAKIKVENLFAESIIKFVNEGA
ncbi:ATP-grasp domain-containing protein [Aeromonas veronii]|uniref:ATP-grasp domain-containing protein n=1 Tax=Aeromonas veronii TaxID=654 RepID=UPI003D24CD81